MSDETYNGWSNRETWAIQLHLSNNEGDYRVMTERAEALIREAEGDEYVQVKVGQMAEYIKDWTEEVYESVIHQEGVGPSDEAIMFVADVGSWWRADFYEIAKHWIDEALESVTA